MVAVKGFQEICEDELMDVGGESLGEELQYTGAILMAAGTVAGSVAAVTAVTAPPVALVALTVSVVAGGGGGLTYIAGVAVSATESKQKTLQTTTRSRSNTPTYASPGWSWGS